MAWALVWFVLGYVLYATVFGTLGSLASRTEDASSVTGPISIILVLSFMVSFASFANPVDCMPPRPSPRRRSRCTSHVFALHTEGSSVNSTSTSTITRRTARAVSNLEQPIRLFRPRTESYRSTRAAWMAAICLMMFSLENP